MGLKNYAFKKYFKYFENYNCTFRVFMYEGYENI